MHNMYNIFITCYTIYKINI